MRIKTLSRYLLEQNLFYILTCLGVGVCLYLLSDLFDRLDDFLEAGVGVGAMLTYFLVKMPLILSQILPAVFLLSVVVQISLMARSREILALRSGGVSFAVLVRFFIFYALVWCLIQFMFAQFLGVYGQQAASTIWAEDVRERQIDKRELYNIWFKEGDRMVALEQIRPAQRTGRRLTVYELGEARQTIERIITAWKVEAEPGAWKLSDVRVLDTETFEYESRESLILNIEQDLKAFVAMDPNVDPASLPMWRLMGVIDRLEASGSNVEVLKTSWHMKWSYAFSILAMALVALSLATISENIYLNVGVSLGITFIYYGIFMIGVSAGQKGLLPPLAGAWLGNIIFYVLTGGWLAWRLRPSPGKAVPA
jgi:lipopolysaccharide export system permease protein